MMSSRQIGLHGSIDIRSDNNENDVVFTNTTKHGSSIDGGKTPAGGKTRRALGDISNRKTQPNGIQDGKTGFPSKTPVPTKTDKTSKTNKKPIKNSATKSLFKQDTSLKPVNLNNHRKVEFKLPSESQKSSQQSFILQTDSVKPLDTKLDDSFDIIQPAGRTWAQQIANGDHDEEPDDLSLEGASTVYEDYFKIQMLEHEHKLKLLKLEDDEASKFIENIYDDWVKSGFEQGKKYLNYDEFVLIISHNRM